MSKITMYDMGFGDAHVLERDGYDEILLVDFGSLNSNKANVNTNVIPNVTKKIINSKANFLLTHFHTDHYNQLMHLPNNCFENIYLRNIYGSRNTIYRSIYELMFFAKYGKKWRNALNTILAVPNLRRVLKSNGKFVFVKKGSKIIHNCETYDVFRPNINEIELEPVTFDEKDANEFVNSLYEKIEALGHLILEYSKETELETIELYDEVLRKKLNERFDEIEKEIKKLSDDYDLELSKESKSKINDFIKSSDEHKYNIIFGLKQNYEAQPNMGNSHINNYNYISTVQQTKAINKLRLLMCGDALKKDVEDVIMAEESITLIDVMKVPHHGTKSHFPILSNVVINNTLIPYSFSKNVYPNSTNKSKIYLIDKRYYSYPFNNTFEPENDFSY